MHQVLLQPFGLAPEQTLSALDRWTTDDWDVLISAAEVHGVLPALYASPISDRAPAEHRAALSAAYFDALTFHLRAVDELAAAGDPLSAAGVRWVVVKGPVLSETCYPRPDLRPYVDVDLLVHPADFATSIAVLEQSGGEILERNWSLMTEHERGELAVTLPSGLVIDLHWHLIFDRTRRRHFVLSTPDLIARSVDVQLGRAAFPALDPVDQLVHVLVHSCLAGGHRLRWSLDLWFASLQLAPWSEEAQASLEDRLQDARAMLLATVMARRASMMLGRCLPWVAAITGRPSAWATALHAVDRVHDPSRWNGGAGSSRLLVGSTRSSTAASMAQLGRAVRIAARELIDNPGHPWWRRRGGAVERESPILLDDPTPGARAAYFDMAARVGVSPRT